ncbi:mitochondrial ribonuclease P protein 1 homolog [Galendromus occidentalis]|uniref:RNA (guanine-9-)-methyltransferase domain-containing protein 1 n=1 Tax=Galendromus occidentalis TaxID=34638 RepID=A0AAJ6VX20_9ACAR|nr:mitochondrial ribonuclease P protein 1 homolog [Galendromus occidentalis]
MSYNYHDYGHLLEKGTISKQQLRAMVYYLNREIRKGRHVPRHLTPELLEEVIQLPSLNKRRRFLQFYAGKEYKEYRKQNPRSQPVYDKPIIEPWTSTDVLPRYGLFANCIFPRIEERKLYMVLEKLMLPRLPFAQRVAVDFSFDDLMSPREMRKLSVDMKLMFAANRWTTSPVNLHLCSFDPETSFSARLVTNMVAARKLAFPYELSPKPVTELFPRENIVYLSPEGEGVLDNLDEDVIYVIGALVDKTNLPGVSARRARELGVRSMRFPTSACLRWEEKGDERPLHLTHCVQILSKLSSGCPWEEAIRGLDDFLTVEL